MMHCGLASLPLFFAFFNHISVETMHLHFYWPLKESRITNAHQMYIVIYANAHRFKIRIEIKGRIIITELIQSTEKNALILKSIFEL